MRSISLQFVESAAIIAVATQIGPGFALMSFLPANLVKFVAAVLPLVAIYSMARLPTLPTDERQHLAARYRFHNEVLPEVAGPEQRIVRPVQPSLQPIAGWISAVGAAIALGDLDGDQLPNDICYVDTRTDQVILTPVPGTGTRFAPFALAAGPLYDRTTMAPTHCMPGDLNEDGLIDILVSYWGRTPIAFLQRAATSGSAGELNADRFVAVEVAPGGERWFTDAATRADVDGDGHIDIIVGNYFADGAHILDASAEGIETLHKSMSLATNGGRNRLLLWTGGTGGDKPTVSYRDASDCLDMIDGVPVATAWTLAVGAADLDGDGLPEIYFGNDFGPDRLLHNRSKPGKPQFACLCGVRTISIPKSKVLSHDSFKGMGVDFGDVNGDGLLDIYVSNIAAEYALEESHFLWLSNGHPEEMKQGIAPYTDEGERLGLSRSGWGWDSRLADFDNDGVLEAAQAVGFMLGTTNRWPELHEVGMGNDQWLSDPRHWHRFQPGDDLSGRTNHDAFFARAADGRYYDIATDLGMGEPQISRGIALADVDGDGKLDFATGNQWQASRFFHNDSPHAGAFLGLRLLLPIEDETAGQTTVLPGHERPAVPTMAAIGAAATVEMPDGRKLVGQVDGGNGHSGVRAPELHFGLGNMPTDAQLKVKLQWRDRHGRSHELSLVMKPDWHTVVLVD
jgi:enediyne biosynthesis protein E4